VLGLNNYQHESAPYLLAQILDGSWRQDSGDGDASTVAVS
jgi:hypothetical protein